MAFKRETDRAAQHAYHEARRVGHSKEEARSIRDNWYTPANNGGNSSSDDDDDDYYDDDYDDYDEPYDQASIDD